MHLAIGNAVGHKNVRHSMRLREQILYLFAGLDIPFGNIYRAHSLKHLRLQTFFRRLALTHVLHRLKRQTGFHALGNQVRHNVVTRGDSFGNRLAFLNQILRIVQPYVRTVRITGYTHNLTEFLRLYVADHLTYKLSATFRDTESADGTVNLLRRNAEGACILEDTHRFFIAHRNLLGIKVGIHILLQIFFQHLQNHRIIVAQNIQLNQTVIDAVIIVVSSNRSAVLIIGRTVHRRNIMDIHITRHNHDAARMLARSALDAGKAFDKRCHMRRMHMQILALVIFSDKAYRRFVGDGSNRTGAANIVAAEKFLGVLVRYALVRHCGRIIWINTAGEVQIDIRNLITVEAQENRKRDIMTVAQHPRAAFGTILRRQVKAAVYLIVHKEFAVTAMRTAVMRLQRVNLGNIQHRSNKRRAYTATRAYQVTAVDRMLNQLMRNVIQYGEAVADNSIQLHL